MFLQVFRAQKVSNVVFYLFSLAALSECTFVLVSQTKGSLIPGHVLITRIRIKSFKAQFCLVLRTLKDISNKQRGLFKCLVIHRNVIHRFMVQVLNDPPLCSSTKQTHYQMWLSYDTAGLERKKNFGKKDIVMIEISSQSRSISSMPWGGGNP